MIIIACCENSYGMMFNNRRVSQDNYVIDKIIGLTKGTKLWVSNYSYSLFEKKNPENINVSEMFLSEASNNEYCFIEKEQVSKYQKWIDEIILFRWNRDYPSDQTFDIDLSEWELVSQDEFQGDPHEKITMEVYRK